MRDARTDQYLQVRLDSGGGLGITRDSHEEAVRMMLMQGGQDSGGCRARRSPDTTRFTWTRKRAIQALKRRAGGHALQHGVGK